MCRADFPFNREVWGTSYCLGTAPSGDLYLREHGSANIITIKSAEALQLCCHLHKRADCQMAIDAHGNALDSRRAELEMLAQSANGRFPVARVRALVGDRKRVEFFAGLQHAEAKHQQLAHGGDHNLLSFEAPVSLEPIDQSNDRWVVDASPTKPACTRRCGARHCQFSRSARAG